MLWFERTTWSLTTHTEGDRYEGTAARQHTARDRDRRTHCPDPATLQVMVAPIASAAPPIFSDEFANLSNWTATRVTLDNSTVPRPRRAPAQAGRTSPLRVPGPRTHHVDRVHEREREPRAARASTCSGCARPRTARSSRCSWPPTAPCRCVRTSHTTRTTPPWHWGPAGTTWSSAERSARPPRGALPRRRADLNAWQADTGTTPVGRIQIGDTAAKTFTANFDHVVVDWPPATSRRRHHRPDAQATRRDQPVPGTIQITWAASTDAVAADHLPHLPGRRRDLGRVDDHHDVHRHRPGAGSSHTYTVDAVDAANNTSAKSRRRYRSPCPPPSTRRPRPPRDGRPGPARPPARSSSPGPPRPTPRRRSPTASTATAARPRSVRRPPRRSPTPACPPARATPTPWTPSTRGTTPATGARPRRSIMVPLRLRRPAKPGHTKLVPDRRAPTCPRSAPVRSATSSPSATGCSSPALHLDPNNTVDQHDHYNQAGLASYNLDTGLVDTAFRPTFGGGGVDAVEASPTAPSCSSPAPSARSTASPSARSPSLNPTTGAP